MPIPDEEQEAFVLAFHHIPFQHELDAMSFVELAIIISTAKTDSPRYMVVERAMKRVLADDQAKISRLNVILGAIMGGAFGLCGVMLGAHLKNSTTTQQPPTGSTMQQIQQGNLSVKPQGANIAPIQPIASQPIPVPGARNTTHKLAKTVHSIIISLSAWSNHSVNRTHCGGPPFGLNT